MCIRDSYDLVTAFLTDQKYIDTHPIEIEGLIQYICDEDKILNVSYLSKFSETNRFNLCDAAAKRSSLNDHQLALLDNRVDEAQIFEIRSNDVFDEQKIEKRVALRCPTSPRIHVYFKNIRVNENVQILVTNNEPKSKIMSI